MDDIGVLLKEKSSELSEKLRGREEGPRLRYLILEMIGLNKKFYQQSFENHNRENITTAEEVASLFSHFLTNINDRSKLIAISNQIQKTLGVGSMTRRRFLKLGLFAAGITLFPKLAHSYDLFLKNQWGNIPKISGVMAEKGWVVSSSLMKEWTNRLAHNNPLTAIPNLQSVDIDWVLTYARARKIFNEIVDQKLWINESAKKQIQSMLIQKHKLKPTETTFGDFSLPVNVLDKDYIQFRKVGHWWLPKLDDLGAMFGRFILRVVVQGKVIPKKRILGRDKWTVNIVKVGVYLRDSVDFNGSQLLAFWNFREKKVGLSPRGNKVLITENDFREYRKNTGKGGDFLVFSNLKEISTNDSFTISDTLDS